MGKLIDRVHVESEYIVQLTQSEVDLIQGLISDLLDNPQRRVRMKYEVDGDYVAPTEKGMDVLRGAYEAFQPITESDCYDYFDYWEVVEEEA